MFIAKGPLPHSAIARHAIDIVIEIAVGKPARRIMLGDRGAAEDAARRRLRAGGGGRAETILSSSRAHVFDVVGDLWETLLDGRQPADRQLARFTTAYAHTRWSLRGGGAARLQGGRRWAVYQNGPLDRCLRDILTVNQHVVGTRETYEMAGRLLFGLEPLRWLF